MLTPLDIAATWGYYGVGKALLDGGANVDSPGGLGGGKEVMFLTGCRNLKVFNVSEVMRMVPFLNFFSFIRKLIYDMRIISDIRAIKSEINAKGLHEF